MDQASRTIASYEVWRSNSDANFKVSSDRKWQFFIIFYLHSVQLLFSSLFYSKYDDFFPFWKSTSTTTIVNETVLAYFRNKLERSGYTWWIFRFKAKLVPSISEKNANYFFASPINASFIVFTRWSGGRGALFAWEIVVNRRKNTEKFPE